MKRNIAKKAACCLMSALMLVGVVTACSDTAKETESTTAAVATEATTTAEATEATTEATEEVVSDGYYPIDYTDIYGNTVTVNSQPKTIVSVSPALTEIIYELNQQDKLIGRTDYDDYPIEVMDIPSVGAIDAPSVEAIVELDPDIILASSIFTEDSYNQLTELGYTVVVIVEEESLNGMFMNIMDVATILNCVDVANEYCASLQERLDAVTPVEDEITVYYCMGFGEYGEYTGGGDTFINEIIEAAGGVNIAKDVSGWMYSLESLIEADPDVILITMWDYDAFIVTEPYSSLKAVQNGNVIVVDANIFSRQCGRNVDAVEVVNEALLNMNAEVVNEAA